MKNFLQDTTECMICGVGRREKMGKTDNIIDVNGKKHMNVKTAAQLWNVSASTVRAYCREDKIADKIRTAKNQWYISVEEIKPISKSEIKKLLFLVLQLKNNPKAEIDWSIFETKEMEILLAFDYLRRLGYVRSFDEKAGDKIPRTATLTEKGMREAMSQKEPPNFDWKNFILTYGTILYEIGLKLAKNA